MKKGFIKINICFVFIYVLIQNIQSQNISYVPTSISRNDAYLNEYNAFYKGNYKDISISIYKKKLDLINDLNDWYNSDNLKVIHNKILSGKIDSYRFSNFASIKKIDNLVTTDYIIFNMFEPNDIRMERDIVIFNNDNIYIVFLEYQGNKKLLEKELLSHNRLINRNEQGNNTEIIWDYINKEPNNLVKELINNKCDISIVNNWYNETTEIFQDILLIPNRIEFVR